MKGRVLEEMEWCIRFYEGIDFGNFLRRWRRAGAAMIMLGLIVSGVYHMPSMPEDMAESTSAAEKATFSVPDESVILDKYTMAGILEMMPEVAGDHAAVSGTEIPKEGKTYAAPEPEALSPADEAAPVAPVIPVTPPAADPADEIAGALPGEDTAEDLPEEIKPITPGGVEDAPSDIVDIPGDVADAEEETDTGVSDPEGTEEFPLSVEGYLVDESGMICGIADPAMIVNEGRMVIPETGCSGIAAGAFAGAPEGIYEVYIPAGITNIEAGAFVGLYQAEWYEVAAANETYYSEDGVIFSDGGLCLKAFPAGRVGIYRVPVQVEYFAQDAFADSMIAKLIAYENNLTDVGNLPEHIAVMQ